jgi:DNA primase
MDEVAEVKSRLEIAEVVGAYVPLKQAGRSLKAPCPFHQERSASFTVSPERGIYKCFGCGEGGDIFDFVMKMDGVDFRQALEMLARKAGVELKARGGDDGAAKKLRERLISAHELAVKYFQLSLVKNQKALEYVVKKRRLGKQTIKDFQIGYAPDSWNGLTDVLVKKGFTLKELLQGGLAGQKEGRSTMYDLFRGRVMFPICDREGRPIGFTGRVLDDGVPKYLNTPQTSLYDKSQAIFGLHLAKDAIRSNDEVVLVEGQMDVVASHQAGVKQVVATSGTALTIEHLRMLSKLTKNIKLAFDADRAGLAATERAIEMGQKLGLTLRMVVLPEGAKDADELIGAQGPEALVAAIGDAKYIVDYLFDRFEKDFDLSSAVGKRGYANRLASNLRRLGDPVEQDHYIKLLADKTGTSPEAVKAKLAKEDMPSAAGVLDPGRRTRPVSSGGAISGPTPAGGSSTPFAPTFASATGPGSGAVGQAVPPALRSASSPGLSGQPVRRAVVQAKGKPTVRVQLEESLLGLALSHPLTRVALDDLGPEHFSSPARVKVFEALMAGKDEPGDGVAQKLGEYGVYANQLMLTCEHEFSGLTEPSLHFESFSLARKVMLQANAQAKKELSRLIQEAEARQDTAEVARLMAKFQEIMKAEA